VNDLAQAEKDVVHVGPGQLFASYGNETLRTVLGSCISVCLWDGRLRVGGMNHFLLPTAPSFGQRSPRHGDSAMDALADMLKDLGSDLRGLTAHVFGGARILLGGGSLNADLGARNAATALAWLDHARIEVAALDVGGNTARRVEFSIATGRASSRKLGGG